MHSRLQSFELKAKDPHDPLSDAHALYWWFTEMTGEDINVEVINQEKKCFKLILNTTPEKRETYRKMLEQHFWVS